MRYLQAHSVSSHDQRYAYASGRIRALELSLLGKARLERLAETADVEEVDRMLSDTVYAAHLDDLEDFGYEVFLRNEESRLLDLVDGLSLDREVSDMLRLRFDFHNLKVALREKISGRSFNHLYVSLGRFEADSVKGPVTDEKLDRLPEPLRKAGPQALEASTKSQDPADADLVIDRTMFDHFLSVARSYGAPFIETMVRTWIDLANIRTFMRARYLGYEGRTLPALLIAGGFTPQEHLTETFTLGLDEVIQRFQFSPYRRVIEAGGAGLEREESFVPLEREIESNVLGLLRVVRYFTFGLEVVLSYALLKQSEIAVLRLILAGKETGMSPEAIKERIPDGQ